MTAVAAATADVARAHDPIATAEQIVKLRLAKRSEEAAEYLTEDAVLELPAVFGTDIKKGKAKILKKWKEQDKDGLKLLREEKFKEVKPNVVQRKVTAEILFFEVNVQQTFWFNDEGKLTKMVMKKL